MFEKARIRLTAWYLAIIMAISLSFSVAIYVGVNRELVQLETAQNSRQQRVDAITNFLRQQGLPLPPEYSETVTTESIDQARLRIIWALAFINVSILVLSGLGGYFLAGLTLEPISKMVEEQKDFISNASHELRTPLTSLKTEIEVALRDRGMDLKNVRDLLKSNLDDVNSMQILSNHLLELSKYENKENKLRKEKLELGDSISRAVKTASPYAEQNNIRVVKKISKVYVKGNGEAIAELAKILIDNAIKYSGKAKKIEVTVKKNGSFSVRDFGIGIRKEDIPHIFDRFYQGDPARSKGEAGGYGLGLAIAQSIVERLDAKIEVESKVGHGSKFSIRFPH